MAKIYRQQRHSRDGDDSASDDDDDEGQKENYYLLTGVLVKGSNQEPSNHETTHSTSSANPKR